jgi:glycerophosphoryl diester phosphodiesterase
MSAVNPWVRRRVFNWAHQGGAREGPSNTLWAMRRALTAGAHGLELDVHRTADGVLVVAHDDELVRMTGAPGRISTSSIEDVRKLDAAHNWIPGKVAAETAGPGEEFTLRHQGPGPVDPELRIPTLDEVLAAFPGVPLNLEIKRRPAAEPLAELLNRIRRDDVIVVSIRPAAIRAFRRLAPSVAAAPGPVALVLFWLASRVGIALPLKGCVAIQVPLRLWFKRVTDRRLVRAAHRRDLAVHVWTVDDPAAMRKAVDLGADGIMTDRPSVLAGVLADLGAGWDPTAG